MRAVLTFGIVAAILVWMTGLCLADARPACEVHPWSCQYISTDHQGDIVIENYYYHNSDPLIRRCLRMPGVGAVGYCLWGNVGRPPHH